MCASMRPGISVRPLTSITRALLSAIGFVETSWIRPSATRTYMPSAQSGLVPSNTRALPKMSGVIDICEAGKLRLGGGYANLAISRSRAAPDRPVHAKAILHHEASRTHRIPHKRSGDVANVRFDERRVEDTDRLRAAPAAGG